MFGGIVHTKNYDGWRVSWESLGEYRFWCSQVHPSNSRLAAIVMLNPGNLSGDGANLSRDTTLRVLRELFLGTRYNPFVINLFNLATPKSQVLFEHWEERDNPAFKYTLLPKDELAAVMYAYGDYENRDRHSTDIKDRISEVRDFLSGVPEIIVPRNKSGTPKHPLPIQTQKLKDDFQQAIIEHASANLALNADGYAMLNKTISGDHITDSIQDEYLSKLPISPKTVDEAVDRLISGINLRSRVMIANMSLDQLMDLHFDLFAYLNAPDFWTENKELIESCSALSKEPVLNGDDVAAVIIGVLWKRIREGHKLKEVK
jgi:hypothetical protein